MNLKTLLLLLIVAGLTGAGGWLAARYTASPAGHPTSGNPAGPKVLFYQSAMHPWIKSDKPGKCTICGMELTPVLEGETGLSVEPGLVSLSSNAITVLHVQSTEIQRGALRRSLRVAGTIDDDDTKHRFLSAYTAGRIEELYVNYVGAEVEAGQPLARFYSPMLLEAERQYLAVARHPPGAGLADDPALLRDAAARRLQQLGLSAEQIAGLPGKSPTNWFTDLPAPVGGTIVNRFVYAGQYVMEGEKLFEIADFSTMWFRFDAYEQDLPWLQPGQEVEVTTPSLPGRSFRAPIRFIDPNLSEMTRSAKVRVEIPNPLVEEGGQKRRLLRHRLYAEGRVSVTVPDLVLVPRSAVLSPAGAAVVYVDRGGGAYEQRSVKLGRAGDGAYEVLAGLTPGESVVIQGNLMIDAQAQLNQVISGAGSETTTSGTAPAPASPPPPLAALSPAQVQALQPFLETVDAARAALAADDLAGFSAAAERLHPLAASLGQAFTGDGGWPPLVQPVIARAHLERAEDLRAARRLFHPLSLAIVDLADRLRSTQTEFAGLKIYQCPMTSEAFDGAPPRARWMQLGAPLKNPWFGASMLDCGSEIRPPATP